MMLKFTLLFLCIFVPASTLFADGLPNPNEVTMNVVNHDDPGAIVDSDIYDYGAQVTPTKVAVVSRPDSKYDRDSHDHKDHDYKEDNQYRDSKPQDSARPEIQRPEIERPVVQRPEVERPVVQRPEVQRSERSRPERSRPVCPRRNS